MSGCSLSGEPSRNQVEKNSVKKSFLPDNDYDKLPFYGSGEVTEDDFYAIIDAALEIYQPIMENFGLTLEINGNYDDPTVNAYCNRTGNNVEVSMFGGLAKHNAMTFYGFSLVICHELGHALSGTVVYPDSKWAGSEGISDYFATASCARKMFDPNSPLSVYSLWKKRKNPSPDQNDNKTCLNFRGIDKQICEYSLSGGLSLAKVLASLNNEPVPNYDNLDLTKIKKTQYSHPKAKCRLTQYYAGATCDKNWNDNSIPKNLKEGKSFQCRELMSCWLNENNL